MTNILIVDDDECLLSLLGEYLVESGYTCWLAGNADEARRLVVTVDFQLILTDIHLPGESGLDFLEWALSVNRRAAGLIMTSRLSSDLEVRAGRIGASFCMEKPFFLDRLLVNLKDALHGKDTFQKGAGCGM